MMKTEKSLAIALLVLCVSCASSQKKIQQANEKNPQHQYSLGAIHLNNNNPDEAIRYFNKALALEARHYKSLNGLGLAYSMKGNLQEAANYFKKCLEAAPQFSEARNNLGMVYQETGFLDKAEEEWKKVVADPEYANKELSYKNLAWLYCLREDWETALSYANKAIQSNSRYHVGYGVKGFILDKLNRIPEAIESYERAVKILPDEVNYRFFLGEAYYKNGDFTRALKILEEAAPSITDPEMREKLNSYLKAIKEKKPPA
jgi:tetratricopeptide (TPR) repeat protein